MIVDVCWHEASAFISSELLGSSGKLSSAQSPTHQESVNRHRIKVLTQIAPGAVASALPVLAQVPSPPVAALLGGPARQFGGVILPEPHMGVPILLPVGAQLLHAPAPLLLPV